MSTNNLKLVAVQVVFRHGHRTPLKTYPKDPHREIIFQQNKPGQLTNKGKQCTYELGKWLRNNYDNLLPKTYSPDDLKVISNDVDRCLMSAQCVLAGLYPPVGDDVWNKDLNWQPIPIHTDKPLLDPIPESFKRMAKRVARSFFKDILAAKYVDVLSQLNEENVGAKIDFIEAFMIRDTLFIESSLGLQLPEWAKQIYPEPLDSYSADLISIPSCNKVLSKASIGALLNEIINNFQHENKKMIMYSAHDYTIAALVLALNPQFPKFIPEYGSTVVLELWEDETKQMFVKMLLKRNNNVDTVTLNQKQILEFYSFKESITHLCITTEERTAMLNAELTEFAS